MKAIQFLDATKQIPRYLLARGVGAVYPPVFWSPLNLFRYADVPEPVLPGPDWVKVKTRFGGICGSDMNVLFLDFNPALAPLVSLPFVLGHENVGVVAEVGPRVEGFAPGDRVVADPLLSCLTRGIEELCAYCERGEYARCQNLGNGNLAPGLSIGFCRDTGGSWGESFVAHQSQLVLVPRGLSDDHALMAEPVSAPLRAVLRRVPGDGDTVLVLGAGTAGLCTLAALRAVGSGGRAIVVAKHPFQGELAREYGADQVLILEDGDLLEGVARATGGRVLDSPLGNRLLVGGADVVYECVGSRNSVDGALRFARAGGRVVLLGMSAILKRVDWTSIWLNELDVNGYVWGDEETFQGRRVRTVRLALEWMAEGRLDLARMVTHRFALHEYRKAFGVAARKARHQAVKPVFAFD
jgi:threonine dehydrogenase-like Zn-dependent dehydrogenase